MRRKEKGKFTSRSENLKFPFFQLFFNENLKLFSPSLPSFPRSNKNFKGLFGERWKNVCMKVEKKKNKVNETNN